MQFYPHWDKYCTLSNEILPNICIDLLYRKLRSAKGHHLRNSWEKFEVQSIYQMLHYDTKQYACNTFVK